MRTRNCGGEIAGWVLPTMTLALLPKCPACVAAYIALATGLGVSFSAASYLRVAILLVSVSMLIFLAARRATRRSSRNPTSSPGCCEAFGSTSG